MMFDIGKTSPPNKGKGRAIAWIKAHVDYDSDDCLTWPFALCRGYGDFSVDGKRHYAHRYMCELVHGPAPSPEHHAAHSCGRGDQGCVNPRHLSWKTPSENMQDKRVHGTTKPAGKPFRWLTQEQVDQIRAPTTETIATTAARFGISESHVRKIRSGENRRPDGREFRQLTDDQVRAIRTMASTDTLASTAARFGISPNSVWRIQNRRTYKYVSDQH